MFVRAKRYDFLFEFRKKVFGSFIFLNSAAPMPGRRIRRRVYSSILPSPNPALPAPLVAHAHSDSCQT